MKSATRDKLPPMEGKAIVVLHGLFRTRSSMASLGEAIVEVGRIQDVLHGLSDDARQRRIACPLARQRCPHYSFSFIVLRTTLSSDRACDSTLPRVVG